MVSNASNPLPYPKSSFNQKVTPPDTDPDEGEQVSVCFGLDWQPLVLGALDQLMLAWAWEGDEATVALALNRANLLKSMIAASECATRELPAPYWDEDSDVDAEAPADDQPWYGFVTDVFAPPDGITYEENAAIWLFTGFIAASGEVGAAIFFHSIAPKFVLAWKRADVGEVFRVILDSADYASVDTTSVGVGEQVNLTVLADPSLDAHDLYIIKQS